MPLHSIVSFFEWFFIISFLSINLTQLMLVILSAFQLIPLIRSNIIGVNENAIDEFNIPVSILVPAYNESEFIVASIETIFQLNYLEYEVIVINDGSTDLTLDLLKQSFSLIEVYVDNEIKTMDPGSWTVTGRI